MRVLTAFERDRAVDRRTAGYTYAQMANELGYTSRDTAYNVVAKALRKQTAEAATDLRDLENARLDALQLAPWEAAMGEDTKAAVAVVKIARTRVHLSAGACKGWLRGHPTDTTNGGHATHIMTWPCLKPQVS